MENQAIQNVVVDPGMIDPETIVVPLEISEKLNKMGYSGRNINVQYVNLIGRKSVKCVNCNAEFTLQFIDLDTAIAIIVLATYQLYLNTGIAPDEFIDSNEVLAITIADLPYSSQKLLYQAFQNTKWFDLLEFPSHEETNGEYTQNLDKCRLSDIGVKWVKQEIALPSAAMLYNGKILGHISSPFFKITDLIDVSDIKHVFSGPDINPE